MVMPVTFVRKEPTIDVVEFDNSSNEVMEDIRDWVASVLPQDFTVNLSVNMGGMISWTGPGVMWVFVRPGEFIARDTTGKLFKMTRDMLDAFYNIASA